MERTMVHDFAAIVERFHRQLRQIQKEDWILPPQPVLHLHCGPAELRTILQVRQTVGPDAILLYLYYGPVEAETAIAAGLGAVASSLLLAAAEPGAFAADLVSMAAILLRYRTVRRSVSPGWEKEFAALLPVLDKAVVAAHQDQAVSRASRISSLEAGIGNTAVMRQRRTAALIAGKKNFPAVVCGAGPSLRGQLDLLKRYRHQFALICVGHAFKTLMVAGIRPDLVVEIDANCRVNWQHGIAPEDIPLAAGIETDPAVTVLFRQLLWYYSSRASERTSDWFGIPLTRVEAGASVIVPALDLARQAGFEHIALIGSDLCFADGQAHVDAGADAAAEKLISIAGQDGKTVYSDRNFLVIKSSLEDYLASAIGLESCFNCTAGGALVTGLPGKGLEDFLTGYGGTPSAFIRTGEVPSGETSGGRLRELREYLRLAEMLHEIAEISALQPGLPPEAEAICRELRNGEDTLSKGIAADWVMAIRQQTDDLLSAPAFPVDRQVPDAPKNMALRYQVTAWLAQALVSKWEQSLNVSAATLEPFCRDIYFQPVFARLAGLTVARSDSDLAAWLRQAAPGSASEFELGLKWQQVEKLSWRPVGGDPVTLDYPLYQARKNGTAVETLLQNADLQPDEGIVWLAPCGWMQVFELVRQQPDRPLIVLEPLPELLRLVMSFTLELHELPEKTVIIGLDDCSCPGWSERLERALAAWRQRGVPPRLLVHPYAVKLPAVKYWMDRLAARFA